MQSSYQNFVSMVSVYSHARAWVVRHKVMENQQKSEIEIVEELVRELSGCREQAVDGRAKNVVVDWLISMNNTII